jgi:hypothetical protein
MADFCCAVDETLLTEEVTNVSPTSPSPTSDSYD